MRRLFVLWGVNYCCRHFGNLLVASLSRIG